MPVRALKPSRGTRWGYHTPRGKTKNARQGIETCLGKFSTKADFHFVEKQRMPVRALKHLVGYVATVIDGNVEKQRMPVRALKRALSDRRLLSGGRWKNKECPSGH